MNTFFRAIVAAAALAAMPVVLAQQGATPPLPADAARASSQAADDVRFRTGADLVVLHVSVRDKKGHDIDGLPQSAFGVYEDGASQPITIFTNEDVPVTVGLLIDSSVSMMPIRDQVIAAATAFAQASHPQDDMFALAFNEYVREALPESDPFTTDPQVLRTALLSSIAARGRTALFDAVSAGLEYVARGRYERRMLIVISDGGDNASHTTFDQVIEQTRRSSAVIFTVALEDPFGPRGNPKAMREMAEESGGQAFAPKTMDDVSGALTSIAHELRHSYTVGYTVPHPDTPGYRRVRVTVRASDDEFVVRTRPGYQVQPRGGRDARQP